MCITQNLTLNKDFCDIKNDYPELKLDKDEISGFLAVPIGEKLLRFEILINAKEYPKILPKLYLMNYKHISGVDRHIYSNRECCVGVGELEIFNKFTNFKVNLKEYIEHLVKPFLFSQIYYDYYGEWPFGEYSHGVYGVREKLVEIFRVDSFKKVISLYNRTINKKIGRNRKCPCRSGLKYKNCHETVINEIMKCDKINFLEKSIKEAKSK